MTITGRHKIILQVITEECSYRTNLAGNFLTDMLNSHTTEKLIKKIKSVKPVNSTLVYLLAEPHMALAEEKRKGEEKKNLSISKNYWELNLEHLSLIVKGTQIYVTRPPEYNSICWKSTAVSIVKKFSQTKFQRNGTKSIFASNMRKHLVME